MKFTKKKEIFLEDNFYIFYSNIRLFSSDHEAEHGPSVHLRSLNPIFHKRNVINSCSVFLLQIYWKHRASFFVFSDQTNIQNSFYCILFESNI